MKSKWIFLSILIVAEILVLSGIGFVVWQGVEQASVVDLGFSLFQGDLFSAESDEEWTFEAEAEIELILDSDGGDVVIVGGKAAEVQIIAHKTAWHASKAKAQQELDDFSVSVIQTGDKIIINYRREPQVAFGKQQKSDTVDFTITVPEGSYVNAATDFGEIDVSKTLGEATVSTKFGNLLISGIKGDLNASSNSGDIVAGSVQSENGLIDLRSDFGNITLDKSDTGSVDAHSNSGSIVLQNVDATGEIQLSSDFGKIKFDKGSAEELSVLTDSGKITLSKLEITAELTLRNVFGDIILDGVTADTYHLDTNSGKIDLAVNGGNVNVVSDFGDVYVSSSAEATIDLYTKSGTVEYSGPLGLGPHSLKTDFGDIKLYLPKDTALTFDLETDFGKLNTEFPITLEGDVKQHQWLGTLNGGGAELKANTKNGDISFEMLSR